MPFLIVSKSDFLIQIVDKDSSEANWSRSTLFAKAGYIRVQQDKG